MHIVFIPYGKREEVELLLRDMSAQKHKLILSKGDKKKVLWIQGQVRLLPFGVYEYVCPKEDSDVVLNTLFENGDRYNLGNFVLSFMRKMIKVKKPKEYKTDRKYLWIKENVNIIPLGIREDVNIVDGHGENKGWEHEAI